MPVINLGGLCWSPPKTYGWRNKKTNTQKILQNQRLPQLALLVPSICPNSSICKHYYPTPFTISAFCASLLPPDASKEDAENSDNDEDETKEVKGEPSKDK